MGRNLSIRKFIPGFLFGGRVDTQDLGDDVETGGGVPDDGSVTPAKLDRPYVEATFGAEAQGQPPGVIRKIIRMWAQDDKLLGESDDEF